MFHFPFLYSLFPLQLKNFFDNSKSVTISLPAANGILRQDFMQIQNNLVQLNGTHGVSEIPVCPLFGN